MRMKQRVLAVLASLGMIGGLVLVGAVPAEAATYSRYSYCTGLNSSVDVRTYSRTTISVNAYNIKNGAYLGSRTGTGTRLYWAPGWKSGAGENVRFTITTGKSAKSISTWCTLNTGWFVTG